MKTNLILLPVRLARSSRLFQVTALLLLLINGSRGQVVPFKIETPLWYIQVGMMVNPPPGTYVFTPPAGPGLWCTPAEMVIAGTTVTARDYPLCPGPGGLERTRHDSAPHVDDIVPAQAWAFDITCPIPATVGARETRVRGQRSHPASHADYYTAVVGAMRGVSTRLVAIHGSIGRHMDSGIKPVCGGSRLQPPSGLPSTLTGKFPTGELLTMVDPATSQTLMLLVLDSVQAPELGSIVVRRGLDSMDLRSMMQPMQVPIEMVGLSLQSVVLPANMVDALKSGDATIEVQTSAHQDGKITGTITSDAQPTASIALQNGNAVVTRDGPGYLQISSQLGTRGTQFTSRTPLTQPATGTSQFFAAWNLPGWDFDGDGQDDLIRTPDGLGYDTGGGDFVELPGKNWFIDVKPNGFDVKLYDSNGNLVKTYELRDNNGDGDFGESGEVNIVTP